MMFDRAWARLSVVVAAATTLTLTASFGAFAAPPAPSSPPPAHALTSQLPSVDFGAGAATSADVAVDGWGDGAGYHLQLGTARSAFTWREIAVLHPAGMDERSWLGYQCVSGDGRFAAVAVLPDSAVNLAAARDHGAFAYSVDLASGQVRPVSAGVGLKYHSPGCGVGATAEFTSNPGDDERSTTVRTVDLRTGKVTHQVTVAGQLTSAVPTPDGTLGVMGAHLVRIATSGVNADHTVAVATTPSSGSAYDLRPTADGGIDFVSAPSGQTAGQDPTAYAWHEKAGTVSKVATGPRSRLRLFPGRAGRPVLAGATQVDSASTVVRVADAALPQGASAASLDGRALLGAAADPTATAPAVLATANGKLVARPHATSTATQITNVPAVTADTARGNATADGFAVGPATPAVAAVPTCGVPRLDPTRQALQPNSAQVNWAAQLAAQGLLNGSFSRPAGYANMGLAAYSPSNDFSREALSHPSSDTWDTVPRSVIEAIMAQESNWGQASWHELPGVAGDPLISSYYGVVDRIDQIDYANADCGYGIAQVTSGMAAADTSISVNGKAKVAVDYAENIAAGLNILQDKWNQLYAAGITANGGDPRYLENWYFALWAYNTGMQPSAKFGNTTGCTPSPSCVGPDGTWGLGWSNNPKNPDYPVGRPAYLKTTYGDAAHPSEWPYQERILGWMGRALIRFGSAAYAVPTYHGGSTWLQVPDANLFCTADARCDPTGTTNSNYCTLADFECWWHQPVNWVNCSTLCATSDFTVGSGAAEPATVNPHPPTCSLDTSKVPTTSSGAPIIVDDQPSPPVNRAGCGASNWSSNGTFSYAFGTNSNGDPIGAIDTHQAGVGFGGHIRFTHTEDGSNANLINTGTWTPNLPRLQYYKIKIHIPATGASATSVIYVINPGGGVSPWKIRVNQHWDSEQWVTIGTFAMQNGGTVQLSNRSDVVGSGNIDYSNFDVAFDAIAFVQMGGTPGQPIGGPPNVIDAPKGSNPAWVQCGCVRRTAGDPVDTSTGYYGDSWTDLNIPGRGQPLNFSRTYLSALADPAGPNGAAALNGPFGYGWTFSYNLAAVTNATSGGVIIKQEDGSQVPFVVDGTGYTPAAPRYAATLTKSGTTYTYTRRGTDVFRFDVTTGRLTAETDLVGVRASPAYQTTLAYDANGHLATITDPANRHLTLTWTGAHITGLSDTAGRVVSYAYDAAGNLSDVFGVGTTRSPALLNDDRTQFGYTATHLLNSVRQPTAYGVTSTPVPVVGMTYDSAERVVSQTDPLGHAATFTYGPNAGQALVAGQTQVTDPAGRKTIYTYSGGLLTTEVHGAGTASAGTTQYTYDPVTLGITMITDPNGSVRSFIYDDSGQKISETDGSGRTTTYAYNGLGELIRTISPVGLSTTYGYDEAGHIKTSTGTNDGSLPYGLLTSTGQQPLSQDAEVRDGNPTSVTTRNSAVYYDDAAHPGDASRTVDARGNTSTSTTDAFGDRITAVDPLGSTVRYGYDTARGVVTSTVSPVGVAAGVAPGCVPPAIGCTTMAYDVWGNLIRTTDPLGHVTSAVYNADGNRISSTDGNHQTTTYGYDRDGRLTTTNRADGSQIKTDYNADGTVADTIDGATNTTTYGYDGQGRQTTRTDAKLRSTTAVYDPAGRVHTVTDPAGRVSTFGYDPSGAMTSVTNSDGVTPNVTLSYDAGGRRASMVDGTGTSTWSYDAYGEVVNQTNGAGSSIAYGYDAQGNATTEVYPGGAGRTVTQTYDKAGRLDSVTDWNQAKTIFGYDPDGDLKTTTYPNGTAVSSVFDGADQLSSTTLKAGSTVLGSVTYPRDTAGQLAGDTPSGVPGAAQTFGYTALEQVRTATSGSTTSTFGYDAADNPIAVGGVTQSFDKADELCWKTSGTAPASPTCAAPPTGATTYSYDTSGDRTGATTGTATVGYHYDQAGRLTGFTSAGTTASYRYDGSGMRASKTVNGVITPFSWDVGGNLTFDGTTSYLYGPGGRPIEQIGASATQWFFTDNLGSTRALTNSSGAIVAGYAYTPYGVVSVHTGTVSTPLQYDGQYSDAESGLLYLRARYYDPATAQFLTVDPAVKTTRSPYGYVNGNPLNDADPSGLCGLWCKVGIGAVVGVLVVGTIACIIAEPCGAIEAGGLAAAAGGGAFGLGVSITVSGAVVTAAEVGGIAGAIIGAVWSAETSGDSSSSSGSSGGSSGADSNAVSTECEKESLDYALKPDPMDHVFGKADHHLQGLVNDEGGEENAMRALIKSVGKVPDGIYGTSNPLVRQVGNYTVTIRGRVMDGVFKISTAFIP